MGNLKEIVGIKNDQDFQTLVDTGTLTYGDQTIEYSDDAIYFTPEEETEIDAYTKEETNTLLQDYLKQDKSETNTVEVYAKNKNGEYIMIPAGGYNYDSDFNVSTSRLLMIDSDGTVAVGTPTGDTHAVNKKYIEDNYLPLSGGTITGNLTITGDITQQGNTYITHAEQVYSTKDYIYLREGNTGGLADNSYTGFEFIKYDGTNNGRLVVDNKGVARVGDVGDEQPLLTRDEDTNLTNGQVFVWNATTNRAESSADYVKNTDYATNLKSGVVKVDPLLGITCGYVSAGKLSIFKATNDEIDSKESAFKPIVPASLDYAIKVGLTTNTETLTDDEKTSATNFIGCVKTAPSGVNWLAGKTIAYCANYDGSGNPTNVSTMQVGRKLDDGVARYKLKRLFTDTPIEDDSCANKVYVDGLVTSLTGTEAPTTSTVASFVGQIYLDTANNKSYQCIAIDTATPSYTWTQLIRATDYASNSVKGVVDVRAFFGTQTDQYGRLQIVKATDDEITAKTNEYHPIVPKNLDYAVKVGLTTNTIVLTDDEKTAAQTWLGLDTLVTDVATIRRWE